MRWESLAGPIHHSWKIDWQAVIAIATLASVFAVLYGLKQAFRELEEVKHTRKAAIHAQRFQELLRLFDELKTEETRRARRYIYTKLPCAVQGFSDWRILRRWKKIEPAINAFDRVGYLVQMEHIDPEVALGYYWPMIWKCWTKSKPVIDWIRRQRKDEGYLTSFGYLYDQSEEFRRKHRLKEPFIY